MFDFFVGSTAGSKVNNEQRCIVNHYFHGQRRKLRNSHFSPYGYIRQQDITREEEIFYFYNFFFSHASSFPENYVWDTVKPNMNISLSSNLNLNLLHYQRLVQPSPHWFLLQFIYKKIYNQERKKWKKYCKILILPNIEY